MAYIVSGGGAFDERMPDLYRIIMYTHVCEKKDLRLPRLRLRWK